MCFLSKGFFLKGDRFSVFWRDVVFFFFFKWLCFCCFCKTQGRFFFFSKWLILFQKIRFLQSFLKKETFFLTKKKKMVIFSPKCFIFSRFLLSKNQKFLFSPGGFTFNKQVFLIKESFFSKRGFSQNGWFYLKGVSFFQRSHFSKIFKGFLFFVFCKRFFFKMVCFFRGFFSLSEVCFFFEKNLNFRRFFVFWSFCFAELLIKIFFLQFFFWVFFLMVFFSSECVFLFGRIYLKKTKLQTKEGEGLSLPKKSVLNKRFFKFYAYWKTLFSKKKIGFLFAKKSWFL